MVPSLRLRLLAPLPLITLVACSLSLDWNSIEGPAVDGPFAGGGGSGGVPGGGQGGPGGPDGEGGRPPGGASGSGAGNGGTGGAGTSGAGQAGSLAGSGGAGPGGEGGGGTGVGGAAGGDPSSAYATAVLVDGPVAYYRFDDDPKFAQIQSQIAAPLGTVEGGALQEVAGALAGDASKAAGFTGARVVLGNAFAFAPGSPFTFEFWVKPDAPLNSEARRVFSKYETDTFLAGNDGFFFTASSAGLSFKYEPSGGGGISAVTDAKATATDDFTYVVVTSDGATSMNLYVNDNDAIRVNLTLDDAGQTAAFLLGDGLGGKRFLGALDEFAVYDKELPKIRIQEHYAIGRQPPGK
jgi:Concanavalin A-like lectin/glucanases superfamily